jgi:hypothetical protein
MTLKAKIYLVGFVLLVLSLLAVPIHRAHLFYHLSYADVLYNLIVKQRFSP